MEEMAAVAANFNRSTHQQETPDLTWKTLQIGVKTMGPSQPNLLPLYAYEITTNS